MSQINEETMDDELAQMFNSIPAIDGLNTEEKSSLVRAITEVYGKKKIADSIGNPVKATDSWDTMASEIDTMLTDLKAHLVAKKITLDLTDLQLKDCIAQVANIKTGAGNAAVGDVLSGKTFTNDSGTTLTGTMANNGSKTFTPKATAQTGSAGYYSGITVNGDADLVAANIVSGKNIFGVTGTAKTYNGYKVSKYKDTAGTWIRTSEQIYPFAHGLGCTPIHVVVTWDGLQLQMNGGWQSKYYDSTYDTGYFRITADSTNINFHYYATRSFSLGYPEFMYVIIY